ncbi:MAG: sulfotransferase family protein, partial [Myxococcales bacterium]|nr:sulfotransferase family protein [Myxococcales bacterium]
MTGGESFITVVSGLPRSGTSLMLQMLEAGGLPVLVDTERPADVHNPRGYFEYAAVRALGRDASWICEARGRAIKVIHLLLCALPVEHSYRVILMRRDPLEVVASQTAMLGGDPPGAPSRERLAEIFSAQLDEVVDWLSGRPEFELLQVDFGDAVERPREVAVGVCGFLDRDLDVKAMAAAVDRS